MERAGCSDDCTHYSFPISKIVRYMGRRGFYSDPRPSGLPVAIGTHWTSKTNSWGSDSHRKTWEVVLCLTAAASPPCFSLLRLCLNAGQRGEIHPKLPACPRYAQKAPVPAATQPCQRGCGHRVRKAL